MIVVDASIALGWSFKDEVTPLIDAVFRQVVEDGAKAPAIWRLEVANSLRTALRKGRIDHDGRRILLNALLNLSIDVDPETSDHAWSSTLRLSDHHGLTVYDAAYLELAIRHGLPLATLDDQLRTAASEAGVAILP